MTLNRHSEFALPNGYLTIILEKPVNETLLVNIMANGAKLAYWFVAPMVELLKVSPVSDKDCDNAKVSVGEAVEDKYGNVTTVTVEVMYWHRVHEQDLKDLVHRFFDLLRHELHTQWSPGGSHDTSTPGLAQRRQAMDDLVDQSIQAGLEV